MTQKLRIKFEKAEILTKRADFAEMLLLDFELYRRELEVKEEAFVPMGDFDLHLTGTANAAGGGYDEQHLRLKQ